MALAHDPRVARRHREAKNATFLLPIDLLRQIDAVVSAGVAPNKTAFVEQALRHELAVIHRRTRRARWEEAMRDPLFLRDLAETEQAYAHADAESATELA
jgi:Arc/MetJ-type ribon-helix-helix transcriptional regulator